MSNGESPFLDSKAFKELQENARTRVRTSQCGILTYFDKWLLEQNFSTEEGEGVPWNDVECVKMLADRAAKGRFVRFAERTTGSSAGAQGTAMAETDILDRIMMMSQGTQGPIRWRGLPLFKSAFDLALYTHLLGEMKPGGIIEIGSGTGASALWLADMCAALGLSCHVISLDRHASAVTHPGVSFVEGDCSAITDCIPPAMLTEVRRPILIIEDAHESVATVLHYFANLTLSGDRIVVEDSYGKQDILSQFTAQTSDAFLVDTFYTDFFGYNVTSAVNSFLIRS